MVALADEDSQIEAVPAPRRCARRCGVRWPRRWLSNKQMGVIVVGTAATRIVDLPGDLPLWLCWLFQLDLAKDQNTYRWPDLPGDLGDHQRALCNQHT